ncbi:MAG TPA: GNAT family N-acetyltransferase, partial [Xanthomonadaceae bacterium]|nr:GNAT family N-acetyltransferase [Xanthomonadaceae bacterium]
VTTSARRRGVAARVMEALETRAVGLGFTRLRLETGKRQSAAMTLYESLGFQRIPAFGDYIGDPTSVCFEKRIAPLAPA